MKVIAQMVDGSGSLNQPVLDCFFGLLSLVRNSLLGLPNLVDRFLFCHKATTWYDHISDLSYTSFLD
jgi:hypothetical protein